MKTILIFLFIALINCTISNQLLNSMKQEAQKIASTMPSDYSKLVTALKADSVNGFDSSSVADFDQMLAKYHFASDIVNQFKMIIISQSIEFQTFQVELTQNYSDIQEFIGAASNYNGKINIAFLQVFSEGTPIPQYEAYHCCHSCWIVSKCCDTCHREIGMTNSQMETVTEALRATAYKTSIDFLNNPSSQFGNYSQEQQKLQDENSWDKLMTSEDKCVIEGDSPCANAFYGAYDQCAKNFKQADYDDIATCAIQKIKLDSQWKPCFLCWCADFYYNTKLTLTKANAECFHLYYPNDPESL